MPQVHHKAACCVEPLLKGEPATSYNLHLAVREGTEGFIREKQTTIFTFHGLKCGLGLVQN